MEFLTPSELSIAAIIFLAKVSDHIIGALRIITIARGHRNIAFFISLAECVIWISSLALIMRDLDNLVNMAAFCLGVAIGDYLGVLTEEKLAMGTSIIRVLVHKDASALVRYLRSANFRVSVVEGESNYGKVLILFAVVKRKNLAECVAIIKEFNPKAFYTVEDLRGVSQLVKKVNRKRVSQLVKAFKEEKTAAALFSPPTANPARAKRAASKPERRNRSHRRRPPANQPTEKKN